jgi:hypothetical protein
MHLFMCHLENLPDDFRLLFVDRERRRCGWALFDVVVSVDAMSVAAQSNRRCELRNRLGVDGPETKRTQPRTDRYLYMHQRRGIELAWTELAISPIQGATTAALAEGALPIARIPALSAGRGNWNGIGNWVRSSAKNGTIQNISISTGFKSAIGSQPANSYRTAGGAVWDTGSSKMGNAVSTWMGAFNPFTPQK